MELRQLVYFKSVAEAGSFVRASEKLNIAQPAISSQIGKLEGQLGTKLFVRHARGVWLTEVGELFLSHVNKILAAIRDAERAVETATDDQPRGTLTIGMPSTVAREITQPLLDDTRRLFPELTLQVFEALSGEIRQWHATDRFDLSVLYHASDGSTEGLVPLLREDLYLLCAANAEGAQQPTIRFADLERIPLHHTSRLHACRLLLDDASEQAGVRLSYVAEVDSIPLLRDFVSQCGGFSIFPCVAPRTGEGNVVYRRIVDPALHLQSYVVPAKNRPLSRGQEALLTLLPALAQRIHMQRGCLPTRRTIGLPDASMGDSDRLDIVNQVS